MVSTSSQRQRASLRRKPAETKICRRAVVEGQLLCGNLKHPWIERLLCCSVGEPTPEGLKGVVWLC